MKNGCVLLLNEGLRGSMVRSLRKCSFTPPTKTVRDANTNTQRRCNMIVELKWVERMYSKFTCLSPYVYIRTRLNIQMSSWQYKNSHYKDKTVSAYLYNGNPTAGQIVVILRRGPSKVRQNIHDCKWINMTMSAISKWCHMGVMVHQQPFEQTAKETSKLNITGHLCWALQYAIQIVSTEL